MSVMRLIAIKKEHLNPNKIIVINNGLDMDIFNPENVTTAIDLILAKSIFPVPNNGMASTGIKFLRLGIHKLGKSLFF